MTPVHMLLLSFAGCAFTLVLGSFLCYHIYLVLCAFFPPSSLRSRKLIHVTDARQYESNDFRAHLSLLPPTPPPPAPPLPPLKSTSRTPARVRAAPRRPRGPRSPASLRCRLAAQRRAGVRDGGAEAPLARVGRQVIVGWSLVRSLPSVVIVVSKCF